MQEYSKYRMITAGIILMFVFAIAAIYTNTKDAALKTMQNKNNNELGQSFSINKDINKEVVNNSVDDKTQNINTNADNETNNQILQITERLDTLERKVFSPQSNNDDDKSVRCEVRGIISDGHIVPISPSEAVNESRTNGKEVLITCIFK